MRYLSVCSGIEAATAAWHQLGWTLAGASEIEAFPRSVLEHRLGCAPVDWDHRYDPSRNSTPLFGDFTQIEAHHVGPIDLLVGGTPCQSFSIAGLRGGLADDRGNLALEFLRLADRTRPRWLVWENVPGVLSSNGGRDFGSILGGMAELGYGTAYRVLDAQHFGVPQRRRRVFVVGYLGDWRRAAAVLFERHSLSGHPAPRREKGKVAPTIPSRSTGGGGLGTDFDCDGGLISSTGRIAHSLRGEGFDASEDGTGRGTPLVPVTVGSLACNTGPNGHDAGNFACNQAVDAGHVLPVAIQAGALRENPESGPDGVGVRSDGIAYTLEARAEVQAICFSAKDYGADAMDDCSPKRRAGGFTGSHQNGGVMPAVAFKIGAGAQAGSIGLQEEIAPTLSAGESGTQRAPGLLQSSAVRRLTPRECERLQGFEDDYTLVPHRGKPAADGPRYKALGNSMAVPCMLWIGERIAQVDALGEMEDAA